jgi:predicted nuclease of predicted toxin-antitoxin system
VEDVGLHSASDEDVWEFALNEGLTIVTKDSDFRQRTFLRGAPPKMIWPATGNCPTRAIILLLRSSHKAIGAFAQDLESALLVLP